MSEEINDGGTAFPRFRLSGEYVEGMLYTIDGVEKGMTLRDYFAAAALQGMMSSPHHLSEDHDKGSVAERNTKNFSRKAYAMADAMISERKK